MFRDGLRALLTSTPDAELVGEATTGEEAISLAQRLQPDVILMDIKMPEVNGITATREIVQDSPHVRVLVVTMFEDDGTVFRAMRAGARGYLLKGARGDEMLRAIDAVGDGGAIFSPAVAIRLMDYFAGIRPTVPPRAFPGAQRSRSARSSPSSRKGKNPEIARRLYLSLKTVQNHVSNILAKLRVADRTQAIIRAREAGLG